MSFEYTSIYFIVILTGNKKGRKLFTPPFYPLLPFAPVSILTVIILSIGSEKVLLFLVLLIHINTNNRVEINL